MYPKVEISLLFPSTVVTTSFNRICMLKSMCTFKCNFLFMVGKQIKLAMPLSGTFPILQNLTGCLFLGQLSF